MHIAHRVSDLERVRESEKERGVGGLSDKNWERKKSAILYVIIYSISPLFVRRKLHLVRVHCILCHNKFIFSDALEIFFSVLAASVRANDDFISF